MVLGELQIPKSIWKHWLMQNFGAKNNVKRVKGLITFVHISVSIYIKLHKILL